MAMGKACDVCGGRGFLIGQTYGITQPPPGAVCLQRCDCCRRYDGDAAAAVAAADLLGTDWGWPPHADNPAMIAEGEDCWVVAPEDLKPEMGWPSDPEEMCRLLDGVLGDVPQQAHRTGSRSGYNVCTMATERRPRQ